MNSVHGVCGLACWLLATLASAQQLDSESQRTGSSGGAQQRSATPASSAPASATPSVQDSLKRIATAQEALAAAESAEDKKNREDGDLQAQKDMAVWAKAMFFATVAGALVSVGATWLLYLTLGQSRRAAYAALRAAVAGRQSVRAARESAEKQLRAYLWRESNYAEGFKHLKDRVTTSFFIKNSGQTPAHDVQCWCKFEQVDADHLDAFVFEEAPDELTSPKFVINPGSEHTFGAYRLLTDYEWSFVYVGKAVLVIWGEIRYVDVFKHPQRTRFRLQLRIDHRDGDTDEYIWSYCSEGNTAT